MSAVGMSSFFITLAMNAAAKLSPAPVVSTIGVFGIFSSYLLIPLFLSKIQYSREQATRHRLQERLWTSGTPSEPRIRTGIGFAGSSRKSKANKETLLEKEAQFVSVFKIAQPCRNALPVFRMQ